MTEYEKTIRWMKGYTKWGRTLVSFIIVIIAAFLFMTEVEHRVWDILFGLTLLKECVDLFINWLGNGGLKYFISDEE